MITLLPIFQVILSCLLIAVILLQNRGTGLGSAFGADNAVYRTKRGIEKTLSYSTVVIAILFFASALANVLLK